MFLTVLFYYALFLFFLIIDYYILTPENTAGSFNDALKLAVPIGIPANKANTKIETHPVIEKLKYVIVQCHLKP